MTPPSQGSLNDDNRKGKFYAILVIGVAISIIGLMVGATGPAILFFGAAAFIAASVYLFLVVHWFESTNFSTRLSLITFLICGAISVGVALIVHRIIVALAVKEVQTGWWLWKETHIQYRSGFWMMLVGTGAFAGITEELIKFGSLIVVAPVRKAIKNRRTGLYYATLCAAGFAMIENLQYFHQADSLLIARLNPAHLVFSSLWGAAYGSCVAGDKSWGHFVKYMGYGMGLHALWNLCPYVGALGGPAIVIALLVIMMGTTIWLGIGFIKNELAGSSGSSPQAT